MPLHGGLRDKHGYSALLAMVVARAVEMRPACKLSSQVLRGVQCWHRHRLSYVRSLPICNADATLAGRHVRTHDRTLGSSAQSTAPPQPTAAMQPTQSSQQQHLHHQTVDYTTLVAVAHDLRQTLCPGKVEQVVQFDNETVALKLRTLSSMAWLHLSWHSVTGHIATGELPERGAAAEAFTFGAQLQAALRGLVLSGVELPQAWERVVRLDFATRPSDPPLQQLHCEIMGRYSNVVLTDGEGNVAAAGYQVGGRMSSLRQVQTGRQYHLPPPAPGIDPDSCQTQQDWQQTIQLVAAQQAATNSHAQGSVLEGCVRAFRGVSPCLVRELCQLAQVEADAPAAALADQQWAALYVQWQRWLERVQSHSFAGSMSPCKGAYSVLGSYEQAEESVLAMLGRYYSRLHATDQFEQVKHRLQRAVGNAVQRLRKKIHSLQKQGGQSDKHVHTSKLADLLMANVHRCTPGLSSVEVEDWDAPGTQVVIPLDPLQSAVECAEGLYRQARKQRRAVEQVAPLVEEAQAQLEYLCEVELMLNQLEEEGGTAAGGDMAALREVQAELVAGGYMQAPPEAALAAKAASKAKRAQKRSTGGAGAAGYREYVSPGGFRVLVGRNSRQNDELTMRVANNSDVWMHARGVPGAHVLLRVPPSQDVGQLDIQFAADLAAWFSKARTEGKADVSCACPTDIRKPKGAKPGQVVVTREKVVVGRPHASQAASMGQD